jgi:hypothetical protein
MTLVVTKAHIKAGRRGYSCTCPIALALNEQHPPEEGQEWHVTRGRIRLRGPSPEEDELGPIFREYALPIQAHAFIQDYDEGRWVDPFEFDLEEPDDTNRPG